MRVQEGRKAGENRECEVRRGMRGSLGEADGSSSQRWEGRRTRGREGGRYKGPSGANGKFKGGEGRGMREAACCACGWLSGFLGGGSS